jgi:hypothetical protein
VNPSILNKEVQDFIDTNLNTEPTKLILKGSPFPKISIQEIVEQIISKKKCQKKLPTWFNATAVYYPNKLNIEQTSSEITANYKANLIQGNSIIDLTGGFGVDCFAFADKFKQVTHCEIDKKLSKIAQYNFEKLKNNIACINENGIKYLQKNKKKYDWVYIDPSRRNDNQKRIFLLEDCEPNVPKYLDVLYQYTDKILLKTSPILDINAALKELEFTKEIYVIAVANEVKEVVYSLEKNYDGEPNFNTVNILKAKNQTFNFVINQNEATYSLPKKYLYEPNAAILKSGSFLQVSVQLQIDKLHKHSHLYTSNKIIDFPGRRFEIVKTIPFNIKNLVKQIPNKKANITTRNFPISVSELRKKTKIKDGGDLYLFFTTNYNDKLIVVICSKINE